MASPPPPHRCYLPSCDYETVPGLSAESQLKELDLHMKYAHGETSIENMRRRPLNLAKPTPQHGPKKQRKSKEIQQPGGGCACLQDLVLGSLSRGFGLHGRLVARNPVLVIGLSVVLAMALSSGVAITWKEETDILTLWQPQVGDPNVVLITVTTSFQDSEYVKNTQWLRKSFPPKSRSSSILIEADNVLEPEILKELLRMIFSIRSLKNTKGDLLWEKKCERTSLKSCTELSVLEGFTNTDGAYDTVTLAALSNIDAVISILNMKDKTSHITGAPFQPNATLGSLTYSGDGKITGAKALVLTLVGVNTGTVGSATSGEETGDEDSLLFEQLLIDLVNNGAWGDGLKVYPFTQRSFSDLVTATEDDDFSSLVAGSLLIFTYVCVNLGKFNSVEQRVWLSVAGILAVAMGTTSSLGVCQLLGFPWSQMNNLLPFLMLGVGIDDMFVIMQSWENLTGEEKQHDLVTRFGITMRHAGVAVTITSVTDLFAFAIGATSVMPGLQSFCIYAALGIFFIYIFQCTFFLGWFVLDQKRLEETRDSCTCAVKRGDWKPWQCSQMSFLKVFCQQVATALVFPPLKLLVVLGTFVLLVFSVYGVSQLERNFDAGSFIDKGTYLRNYMDASAKHFPTSGDTSRLYMTNLTYARDLEKIGALSSKMSSLSSIEKLNSWYPAFINYVNRIRKDELGDVLVPKNAAYSEDKFRQDIVAFLADPDGLTYRNDFEFPRFKNT